MILFDGVFYTKEDEKAITKDTEILSKLLSDKVLILEEIKKAIDLADELNDIGTESFLSALLEGYEKDLWMLNALNK